MRYVFALGLLGVASVVAAQHPAQPAPRSAAPLFVRLAAPAGTMIAVFRGGPAEVLPAPALVGMRPGYLYRIELRTKFGIYHPTLEVRGSLQALGNLHVQDFPATINFTEEDFLSAANDVLVTKAIVLERPDLAVPQASTKDQPLEFNLPPGVDPLKEAMQRGRPVLIVRLGQRVLSPEELAAAGIPGTMILPGEKVLPPPPVPPCLPWACLSLVDPKLGPRNPADEMCFHDGGDQGTPAGVTQNGKLLGLDPSDTVAEYADSKGMRRLAISNKVCLCVPRFLVYRSESTTTNRMATVGPNRATAIQQQTVASARTPALSQHQNEHLGGLSTQMKVSGIATNQGTAVIGRIDGTDVVASARVTNNVTGLCLPPEQPEPPDGPLVIIKFPDRCAVNIGDLVTFTLRYTNKGGRPITGVVVSDSLTTRLEYVPGTARSDRDGVFTTQANEAGSVVLRWEIQGALPPGQSGVVSFQARVR